MFVAPVDGKGGFCVPHRLDFYPSGEMSNGIIVGFSILVGMRLMKVVGRNLLF